MKLILFAGPCVIESKEVLRQVAKELAFANEDAELEFYFKSSFDKANRTSLDSFRGPGLELGLQMLADIKSEFGYKIITDIHESNQASIAAQVADVLQIPAFLCRQTDLLVAAAKTEASVNIKKGQFLNPNDMRYSVAKIAQTRGFDYDLKNPKLFQSPDSDYKDFFKTTEDDYSPAYKIAKEAKICAIERGFSFGYGNLVVDMRSLIIMRRFAPVVFDATHSVQLPGAAGGSSSGAAEFVKPLARAAAGVGVDGFFFEVHSNPCQALCDGPNMLATEGFSRLINQLKSILKKG